MKNLPPEDRAGKYREMRLGSQGMIGPNGQIPNAVVGEYGALAYLMIWGMLRRSVGEKAAAFMDKTRMKLFLRMPVQFMYYIFMLFRRERIIAVSFVAAVTGVIIGVGGTAICIENYHLLALLMALALILDMAVIVNLLSYPRIFAAVRIFLIAVIVIAVGLLAYYWPRWIQPLIAYLCSYLAQG